jgi:3-hydroxybutyryl-CoA dehydrogenase
MATPSLNSIRSVGVIGAGQMGSGIAHVCALAGYDVKIADISEPVLKKAITLIDTNMGRQVARGRVSEDDKSAALKRINIGTDYKLFNQCDFATSSRSSSPI